MSCGCGSDYGSWDGGYNGGCDADTPYPSVSNESVPSLINNLVLALYGHIQKNITSGQVTWVIPCDPNNTATIGNVPRNPGEGLLCYIIRSINAIVGTSQLPVSPVASAYNLAGGAVGSIPFQTAPGATSFLNIGTLGQVLSVGPSNGFAWLSASTSNVSSSLVSRDNQGNFSANVITASLTGNVQGNVTGNVTGNMTGNLIGNADTATTANVALTANSAITAQTATTATNATNASLAATATLALSVGANAVNSSAIVPGAVGTIQLANSGVTAGTYGSQSTTPVITIDATGRVTSATAISQPTKTTISLFPDQSHTAKPLEFYDGAVWVDSNNRVRTAGNQANTTATIQTTNGRLGTGADSQNSTGPGYSIVPISLATNETITNIYTTSLNVYVLTSLGNLYGWGNNGVGQLGQGTSGATSYYTFPVKIPVSNIAWFSVSDGTSTGYPHCLAVNTNGVLYSWGNNSNGECGVGSVTGVISTPTNLTTAVGTDISGKTITKAYSFGEPGWSFVIDNTGQLYSCGYNGDGTATNCGGQLGTGDTTQYTTFKKLNGVFAQSVYGVGSSLTANVYRSSTFIINNGQVFSTGDNTNGALGINSSVAFKTAFTLIPNLSNITQLAGGNGFNNRGASMAALTGTGTLYTWGNNVQSQLGTGNQTAQLTPVQPTGTSGLTFSKIRFIGNVENVGIDLVALNTNGVIYSCGYHGRLTGNGTNGNGATANITLTPATQGNVTFVDFCLFGNSAANIAYGPTILAKDSQGNLWSWCNNQYYQGGSSQGSVLTLPQKSIIN